jgi:hypothetical protein
VISVVITYQMQCQKELTIFHGKQKAIDLETMALQSQVRTLENDVSELTDIIKQMGVR